MIDVVYVTGNEEKARNFTRHIGLEIAHQAAELDEIQTLDIAELVGYKARQAFAQIKRPVLVEDVQLSFSALDGLPGPFIKFFVHAGGSIDAGVERMSRILDGFDDRGAVAECTFGYYDGVDLTLMTSAIHGSIAKAPLGTNGFGFDKVFIPDGFNGKTAAELDEADYDTYYAAIKPFDKVKEFLETKNG